MDFTGLSFGDILLVYDAYKEDGLFFVIIYRYSGDIFFR
jgi:hypothetical protein